MQTWEQQALRRARNRARAVILTATLVTGGVAAGWSVTSPVHEERHRVEQAALQNEFWEAVAGGGSVSHPGLDRLAREIRQVVGVERDDAAWERLQQEVSGGLDSDEKPIHEGVSSAMGTQVFDGGTYDDDHTHGAHQSSDIGSLTGAFETKAWFALTERLDAVVVEVPEKPGWPLPHPGLLGAGWLALLAAGTLVRGRIEREEETPALSWAPGHRLLEAELALTRPLEALRRRREVRRSREAQRVEAAVLERVSAAPSAAALEARAHLRELEGLVQSPVVRAQVELVRQICLDLEAVPHALATEACEHRAAQITAQVKCLAADVEAARGSQRQLWAG